MQETPIDTTDVKVVAARDLLRLFAQSRAALENARRVVRRGKGDPELALAKVRCKLVDEVWRHCLLFDEATIYALSRFVSAWRDAAYALEPADAREADAVLDESYRRVLLAFRASLGTPARREATAVAARMEPGLK